MVMATTVTIWSGIDYAKSVIEQVGRIFYRTDNRKKQSK